MKRYGNVQWACYRDTTEFLPLRFAKPCKALSIPIPPAGHWAKKRAGWEDAPVPLPAYSGSEVFLLRAERKESLVEWVMKASPPLR